jgi:hypothetical protein
VGFKEMANQGRLWQSWRLDTPATMQKFFGLCVEVHKTKSSSRGGCYVILRVPACRRKANLVIKTIKNTALGHLTIPSTGRPVRITHLTNTKRSPTTSAPLNTRRFLNAWMKPQTLIMLTRVRIDRALFNMKHVGMLWVSKQSPCCSWRRLWCCCRRQGTGMSQVATHM